MEDLVMKTIRTKSFVSARHISLSVLIAAVILDTAALGQATEKVLLNFWGGAYGPYAGVVFDGKGNLYGTVSGSVNRKDHGAVIELKPSQGGWRASAIYTFTGYNDGATPMASLIFDGAGNLYGTTAFGGASDAGTVFELSPAPEHKWIETVLYSFTGTDGDNPEAALVFDQAGNLYGTTAFGGSSNAGTVFELSPSQDSTWTEKVLYSFAGGTDGAQPLSSLIFDASGDLLGTTAKAGDPRCQFFNGCGTVFELSPRRNGTWLEKTIYKFLNDGVQSLAGLVLDSNGNLYGTTTAGGTYDAGVVFQLVRGPNGGWKENVLHSFCTTIDCNDGYNPAAGLIFDATGNLYGTTARSGTVGAGAGSVFEISPDGSGGWTETVLYEFTGDGDGSEPLGGVILDSAGNLYGTTYGGGSTGFGTVFEIIR
jgi:uncharacterized repeat protein (TIGR03803 family)